MMYESIPLNNVIDVDHIYTIHYFEYRKDFHFSGESHDFWEFLCVDKGEVEVTASSDTHILRQNDIIFHQPNEFHNVKANGKIAPNLIVISFGCSSSLMDFFRHKILKVSEQERNLLSTIIREARLAFDGRLDNPYQQKLVLKDPLPVGSLQIIKQSLERMFLSLYRRYTRFSSPDISRETNKSTTKNADHELYHRILAYMEQNITSNFTMDTLCHDTMLSSSKVERLFRTRHNCGPIHYFCMKKVELAKELIRSDDRNFTQISECLGYSSIHYFSRQFKKFTGMTPSEYASSIKGLSERRESSEDL